MPCPEDSRAIAYWRQLLARVAEDLETAADAERDRTRKAWLERRVERIRQRLSGGVPEDFEEPYTPRMNPRGPMV